MAFAYHHVLEMTCAIFRLYLLSLKINFTVLHVHSNRKISLQFCSNRGVNWECCWFQGKELERTLALRCTPKECKGSKTWSRYCSSHACFSYAKYDMREFLLNAPTMVELRHVWTYGCMSWPNMHFSVCIFCPLHNCLIQSKYANMQPFILF